MAYASNVSKKPEKEERNNLYGGLFDSHTQNCYNLDIINLGIDMGAFS